MNIPRKFKLGRLVSIDVKLFIDLLLKKEHLDYDLLKDAMDRIISNEKGIKDEIKESLVSEEDFKKLKEKFPEHFI